METHVSRFGCFYCCQGCSGHCRLLGGLDILGSFNYVLVEVKISLYGQVFECAQTGVGGHVACGECASGGV